MNVHNSHILFVYEHKLVITSEQSIVTSRLFPGTSLERLTEVAGGVPSGPH